MRGSPVGTAFSAAYLVLYLFLLCLIGRLVMDYVMMFARRWRPGRWAAVALETVWSVTDPPIRGVRRVLPPLRIGGMSIDLGFLVLFVVVYILMTVVGRYAV